MGSSSARRQKWLHPYRSTCLKGNAHDNFFFVSDTLGLSATETPSNPGKTKVTYHRGVAMPPPQSGATELSLLLLRPIIQMRDVRALRSFCQCDAIQLLTLYCWCTYCMIYFLSQTFSGVILRPARTLTYMVTVLSAGAKGGVVALSLANTNARCAMCVLPS